MYVLPYTNYIQCSINTTSQSSSVSGWVNITFDGWQAGNTYAFFAVTGHWIEETEPTKWEPKNALLGFTKVNNAHNGKRLGGVLFKILDCVGIAHKVKHICHSASAISDH